jgi:hypothetical protein
VGGDDIGVGRIGLDVEHADGVVGHVRPCQS